MIVLMKCPRCGAVSRTAGYRQLDVRDMAKRYRAGATLRQLAERYGVSYSTARNRLIEAGVPLRPRANRRGDA